GARRRLSWRQFILSLGLHTREEIESPDFARDPVLRLCHRMMAHSIAERSQAPEKNGAHISGEQFVARLAEYFGLLTDEILGGLTVITLELQIINMAELDALIVVEGGQAIPAPVQAPQQPPLPLPTPAKTMPQRMARLEEDMHEIRGALTEQRETHVPYQRRVRCRTDEASTSAAQQDQQQPDP
ncbi:hypothetical protein Tco_1423924, partial [Tanacetum coccineum]